MPFKHNESRRHRIGRMNFKVTNWQECEAGLRRRGSLTVWLTLAAPLLRSGDRDSLDAWPVVFGLRQTDGLVDSVLSLIGLKFAVPDRTTLSRRAQKWHPRFERHTRQVSKHPLSH
jgi:hypothetical protein